MDEKPCPYVTGTVTRYCTLTPLTLTDAERDAIMGAAGLLNWCDQNGHIGDGGRKDLETLRMLLDRTNDGGK